MEDYKQHAMADTLARTRLPRTALSAAAMSIALALAVLFVLDGGSVRAQGQQSSHLGLNASGTGVSCDAPTDPHQCDVPVGGPFTLAVQMVDPPSAGYVAIQTQLYLDAFTWTPKPIDEENVWPDNRLPVRSPASPGPGTTTTVVEHGGLTAVSSPLPVSRYAGNLVEVQLACPQEPKAADVALLTYTSNNQLGSSYSLEDGTAVAPPPVGTAEIQTDVTVPAQPVPVSAILMIKCGGQQAPPVEPLPGYQAGPGPGQTPGVTSAPGTTGTPSAGGTPRTAVSTTATPGGTSAGNSNGGGSSTWIIIVVVVAAVAVLGAGGGYWWYIRHRSAS